MTDVKMKVFYSAIVLTSLIQNLSCEIIKSIKNGEIFDFIVVGGGATGCTLAGRLTETGNYSVLLIEAGGIPDPDLEIPGIAWKVFKGDSKFMKSYDTVPQENAGLANHGIVNYATGYTLGGGTAVNVMTVNRGNPHDYDLIANFTGDSTWNYQNMLKYFKKFENYSSDFPSDQRGFNGPISIQRSKNYNPGLEQWLQAGRELGYSILDANGPQMESFGFKDFSRKNGRRVSSYKGYVEPHLTGSNKRNNLHVLINTAVSEIIFEGNHAVGVKFTTNSTGEPMEGYANVRHEVILTAGSIETPMILLRSGIGPRNSLMEANIPALKDLPVGANLHDHPIINIPVVLGNKSAAMDVEKDLNPETWNLYLETGDGPYSSFLGSTAQAFLVTENLPPQERKMGWVNVLLSGLNGNGFSGKIRDLREWEIAISWSAILGRPKSRGSLKLGPGNTTPLLDFQYLTHPDDIQSLIEGLKLLLTICETTEAFIKIGCRIPNDPLPACNHLSFRSDSYWECYIKQLASTNYHAVGTCSMGKGKEDLNAVVDTEYRVIGLESLRVCDVSILPIIVNSNTQAVAYAIAEKAADLILQTWN